MQSKRDFKRQWILFSAKTLQCRIASLVCFCNISFVT
uniref:Uncharacterized protein n=1 Tax=Rhizophora mucronata TaxID=61149 RepID=A0A2P2P8G9_RHIMU